MHKPNRDHFLKLNFVPDVLDIDGFVEWAEKKNFIIHEFGHPGKEAHRELSNLIEQRIFEKYGKLF